MGGEDVEHVAGPLAFAQHAPAAAIDLQVDGRGAEDGRALSRRVPGRMAAILP
jgi:hypothetical protein